MTSPVDQPQMTAKRSTTSTLQNDCDEVGASEEERSDDVEEKAGAWKSAGTAPDGGLAAWLMVSGAWCVLFCSFGWINSMLNISFRNGAGC
jgi:hypothetical protein